MTEKFEVQSSKCEDSGDARRVTERLRMLGEVLNAMRFVTPGPQLFNTPIGKLRVPKEYDEMVTSFVAFALRYLQPLDLDVDVDAERTDCVVMTVAWKAETQKAESGKNEATGQ